MIGLVNNSFAMGFFFSRSRKRENKSTSCGIFARSNCLITCVGFVYVTAKYLKVS